MRTSFAVVLLLGALMAAPQAMGGRIEASFEPRRVEAAPGQSVKIQVKPASVAGGIVAVAFSVDQQASRGLRASGPDAISRMGAGGLEPVELTVDVPANVPAGEIAVTVIAQLLTEGQQPGPGTDRDRLANAFVVAVSAVPSIDFLISSDAGLPEASKRVSITPPNQVPVKLVARSKNGFEGPVNVTVAARRSASVLAGHCPDPARRECALQSLSIDVKRDGEGVGEILLSAGEGAMNDRIVFTATAPGVVQKTAVVNLSVMKPAVATPPAAPAAKAGDLVIETSRESVTLAGGQPERISVGVGSSSRWQGTVFVSVTAPPWVRVEPSSFSVRAPGSREVTLTGAGPGAAGRIIIQASGGGASANFQLSVESSGGAPLPIPAPIPTDPAAPLPPLPPQFGIAVTAVETQNRHLDGLGATLGRLPAVIDSREAAQQTAMLRFYDALIAELRSPASFALVDDGPIDPEIVNEMIARSGVLERDAERRVAVAQIAALTGPQLLFQMDYPLIADRSGIPIARPGQTVSFTPSTKLENLMAQLMIARSAAGVQMMVTGPARQAIDALNNGVDQIEEKIGDQSEGRLKKTLKRLMVVTAAVTVADVAAKGVMAYFPNEITAFYAEIRGQRRNEGDPPVDIVVGEKVPIRVLIETRSPGGQIVTPSEVAGWVWGAVPLDDLLGKVPGLNKFQFKDELQKEIRSELIKLVERIWTKATGLPPVKEWLAAMDKSWDVKPFNNPPVEVNSNKVLKLESRSPALIRIGETRAMENKYHIEGIHEGTQAGYHVALKQDLIEAFNSFSKAQLGRYAVVNVVDPAPAVPGRCAGQPNSSPNAGKACRYADGYHEGSKEGVLILPAGGDQSQYPGFVLCDGTCAFAR